MTRKQSKRRAWEAWGLFLGRRPDRRTREAFERIWKMERAWEGWQVSHGGSDTREAFAGAWREYKAGERRVTKRGNKRAQEAFEGGERGRLLWVVGRHLKEEKPLPAWARDALLDVIHRARTFQIGSWDEAFGRLLEKGEQLAAKRRRWVLARPICNRVWERHEAGEPLTKALFESVGRELDGAAVSGTVVEEIYYYVQEMINAKPLRKKYRKV